MTATSERALAVTQSAGPIALQLAGDQSRLAVLKDVIAKGCDDAELETFALVCQRTKLDPFAKQIYAIKRWDGKEQRSVLTIQTSIDGFRLIAQRTGRYAGQVGPFWCGEDGVWRDVWLSDTPPAAARVGVRLKGVPEPVWGVAVWKRAAVHQNVYEGQGTNRHKVGEKLSDFWTRMGPEMLAITAERNAIRRACPQDTYGLELATPDELEAEHERMQANSDKYERIYGSERTGSAYDLDRQTVTTPDGYVVDPESGEVLDVVPETEAPKTAPDPNACVDCGAVVLDQSGRPINDNQRALLLDRFGKVLCRTCRAL